MDYPRYRFGVIGAGTMGARHARSVKNGDFGPHVTLGAICDVDAGIAESLGEGLSVPWFTDVDSMLRVCDIDVVYLAVPDPYHRDPFVAAVERGVPVLVEKPLATTVEDAVAMYNAAHRANVLAEVNFANRWNPPFVAAKAAIDRGEVGRILGLNARLNNAIMSPTRLLKWAQQTTSGWFLLSHVLDLARWFDGRSVERVWANGTRQVLSDRGIETYDMIHVMARYTDGTTGIYESAWVLPDTMPSPVDFKYEIIGANASIFIDTQDQMIHLAGNSSYRYPMTLDWAPVRIKAFLDRLAAGDKSLEALRDGIENTRTLVALHDSLSTGDPVDVIGRGDGSNEVV